MLRLRHFRTEPGPMILTCPNCQTRYRTDAASFSAGGRKVRCVKCGETWHQAAPYTEPAAPEMAGQTPGIDAPTPVAASPAPARWPRPVPTRPAPEKLGIAAGWTGLIAMILLFGWVGFRFRQEIAALWPQSSALYATFGVGVNTHGIEIDDVSYKREIANGQSVLAVTAKLVNVSKRELPVPPVHITLTDDTQ